MAHVKGLALALLLLPTGTSAQMSMSAEEEEMLEQMGITGQPMGRKDVKPMSEPFKKDLKYIYCDVCRKMVKQAYTHAEQTLKKRFKHKKKSKRETTDFDGENALQVYTETICNPLKPEGEWVTKIDLVLENEALVLAPQQDFGKCRRECRTIEAACNDVLDKADTEFTEILYNGVSDETELEKIQRYICNRAARVCKKKPPKLTSRAHDEKFQVMTADEKQMQDMQANMKDSGMSGTMYRREDLAGMMEKMEDMLGTYSGDESVSEGALEADHSGDEVPDYVSEEEEEDFKDEV